ncbi:bifunctional proline dehydrogenase/L-glutamate gamma-semialdehyde dehydrogenase PutA [Uliginosibacterium sp. H1]|uniref:bifunctional proline dehydrogenase/L-glutamate gamma-semialdehyde dehydrogenase PutA n=1 Tax=Uliginosibacterium sp. H1 TaxID=3114757 RepID=UPI002E19E45C|nr:bifunctional proline dehydrogenase/L-glutamate gamma-semialdehyde dehydrogenase PutA [Uliginosibacterium sp. H1]
MPAPLAHDPFASLHAEVLLPAAALRAAITAATLRDEAACVAELLAAVALDAPAERRIEARARGLIHTLREQRQHAAGVDALMHEFSLDSQEGVALMCLAEALLRIPDTATRDALIRDKLGHGDWQAHLGHSPSTFVNAAAWGLVITGKLISPVGEHGLASALRGAVLRSGEGLIRRGMDLAMRMLGEQFIAGRSIDEALLRAQASESRGYRHSYDMLGEAALCAEDAERYFRAYADAIDAVGRASAGRGVEAGPGVSIKLSALHPRFSRSQRGRVMAELLPRLQQLVQKAAQHDIGLNIDAEEADRLELSLDLFEALAQDGSTSGYTGLGFVVQAYQRRATRVVNWLADLARRNRRRLMVRLVKGAYWDSEIHRAQAAGLASYPVFTRKPHTDLSYLACAARLFGHAAGDGRLYPQFATHNALTVATLIEMGSALAPHPANGTPAWEFQCLHGMGEGLYDQIVETAPGDHGTRHPCRVYDPVGPHDSLLAYLVRRLLENGANSSFVNRLVDSATPVDSLLEQPAVQIRRQLGIPHPRIPPPADLYAPLRRNSQGLDFADEDSLRQLHEALRPSGSRQWFAAPSVGLAGKPAFVVNPADHGDLVGEVCPATPAAVETALRQTTAAMADWARVPSALRADLLERAADRLEAAHAEFIALLVREAGKTLPNAQGEIREAVDFLRYYAAQVRRMSLRGTPRGLIACISPWNFPLAIFTGQVAAALAAGNVVIAKPAEQTPLVAARMVSLLHDAGVPQAVLALLPGEGDVVGATLVGDERVAGVMFTGSSEVADSIRRAQKKLPGTRMLIAETGGVNAMIVDSSALPEQAVADALSSAFDSAGQRCSALRVLCLQEDIAPRMLPLLLGALRELSIGNPARLATDVGPVIDERARRKLHAYAESMRAAGYPMTQLPLPAHCAQGTFFPPTVIEIERIRQLPGEVFGPVLHVLRWQRGSLAALIGDINATGYGLTMGVHSRIDETVEYVRRRAQVGNLYVNRNMIGAVVGVQPFGGEGRSGTGPKAGGPLILHRLRNGPSDLPAVVGAEALAPDQWSLPGPAGEDNRLYFTPRDATDAAANPFPRERAVTRNLAASGGNASLMSLRD